MLGGKIRLSNRPPIILPIASVMVFASTGTALALDAPWTGSGTPTTTVVSNGSVPPAAFHYDVVGNPCCGASGSWSFSTVAVQTRTVVLKYRYTGFHAFFMVTVNLNAFVGTNTYALVTAGPVNCCTSPSGGFSYTGSVALNVSVGQSYGFTLAGSNFDSNAQLQGTLIVDELNKDDCKDNGWASYKDLSGNQLFHHQGDCVSFVTTGGTNGPGVGN